MTRFPDSVEGFWKLPRIRASCGHPRTLEEHIPLRRVSDDDVHSEGLKYPHGSNARSVRRCRRQLSSIQSLLLVQEVKLSPYTMWKVQVPPNRTRDLILWTPSRNIIPTKSLRETRIEEKCKRGYSLTSCTSYSSLRFLHRILRNARGKRRLSIPRIISQYVKKVYSHPLHRFHLVLEGFYAATLKTLPICGTSMSNPHARVSQNCSLGSSQ